MGADKTVILWELSKYFAVITSRKFKGHGMEVSSVCFDYTGTLAVSSSRDTLVCVWDLEGGESLRHGGEVHSLCWSSDGSRLVSGTADNHVRVWDVHEGACKVEFRAHGDKINCAQFSPCDRMILAASNKSLKLWYADGLKCLAETTHFDSTNRRPSSSSVYSVSLQV